MYIIILIFFFEVTGARVGPTCHIAAYSQPQQSNQFPLDKLTAVSLTIGKKILSQLPFHADFNVQVLITEKTSFKVFVLPRALFTASLNRLQ